VNKQQLFILYTLGLLLTGVVQSDVMAQQRKSFGNRNLQEHDHRPYHFGYSLGFNYLNFALQPVDDHRDDFEYVLPSGDIGFHIGIVSNLKLGEYFDLRFVPTVLFNGGWLDGRSIDYKKPETDEGFHPISNPAVETGKYEAVFLEFPFHIKYKSARMINARTYVIGGFKYTYAWDQPPLVSFRDNEDVYARLKGHDFHYEMGVGLEYYFYYFKFAAEIKASFGIRDLLREAGEPPLHYDPIAKMKSKAILISLLFE
jgi:hypothetical protein